MNYYDLEIPAFLANNSDRTNNNDYYEYGAIFDDRNKGN